MMSTLLASKKTVVATIALKGKNFISEVKNLPGVELWELTRKNRNFMPDKVISWIRKTIPRIS
jgi:nucleoside-triphosphatase THEP1